MSWRIVSLSSFTKNPKRLYKRDKKLPNDLKVLHQTLLANPKAGIELRNNCYNIRLANSSIPPGKSGGFRVIYYYYDGSNRLFLLTIFSKRDFENINDKTIKELAKKVNKEI